MRVAISDLRPAECRLAGSHPTSASGALCGKAEGWRKATIAGPDLCETATLRPQPGVTIQSPSPRGRASSTCCPRMKQASSNTDSTVTSGLRGKEPSSPAEPSEQAQLDSSKGNAAALLFTLKRTRALR